MESESESEYICGQQCYSYLIFKDSKGLTNAKNGYNGNVDFSNNDTSIVIQNVINALTSGGKIFIKAGIYAISQVIYITSNIIVEGEGIDKTILETSDQTYIMTSNWILKNDIKIKDVQFKSSSASTSALVYIKNCNEIHIDRCKFDGGNDAGLSLSKCERSSITNCIATNAAHKAAGAGINVTGFGGIISSNIAYLNKCVGIAVVQSGNDSQYWECVVSNNICYENGTGDRTYPGHGIEIESSNRVIVIGNHCYKNDQYGIISYKSKNTLIIGNYTYKNDRNGIVPHGDVNGNPAEIEECDLITGNITSDNTYAGIALWNAQKCYISSNIVMNNGTGGITENENFSGFTNYNIIKDNDVRYQVIDQIIILGDNTIVIENIGYITENSVLSDPFVIDSTGIRQVIIPHGLSITPEVQDCSLTVMKDTDVLDWTYNLFIVDKADSSNVVAKINITTASMTKGATAKLGLKIG